MGNFKSYKLKHIIIGLTFTILKKDTVEQKYRFESQIDILVVIFSVFGQHTTNSI